MYLNAGNEDRGGFLNEADVRIRPVRKKCLDDCHGALVARGVMQRRETVRIAAIGFRAFSQFYDWLTAYPSHGKWGHLAFSDLPKAAVGAGRALVGADFVLALHPGSTVSSIAQGDAGAQRYLMRGFSEPAAVVLCAFAAAIGVALVAALASRRGRHGWEGGDRRRVLDRLALAWIVPYTLFFIWWEPLNLEFWIAWWIPVAVLVGPRLAALGAQGGQWRLAVPAVLGCLVLVNLIGSILPQDSSRDDYWRVRSQWYELHARSSDKILASGYVFSNYLRYFTPAQVLDIQDLLGAHSGNPGLAVGGLLGVLAHTPGTRTLASDQVFFPDQDRYSSCRHTDDCTAAALVRPFLLQYARLLARAPLETVRELPRLPRIVVPRLPRRDLTHVPHR